MPIINPPAPLASDDVPPTVHRFFEEHTFASHPELLRLLEMDYRTLAGLIEAAGDKLPFRTKGKGMARPRRAFTLADVKILIIQMTKQGENDCPIYPARTFKGPRLIYRGHGASGSAGGSASPDQLARTTKPKPKRSQPKS